MPTAEKKRAAFGASFQLNVFKPWKHALVALSIHFNAPSVAALQSGRGGNALTAHQIHSKSGLILGSRAQACRDTHRPSSWRRGGEDVDSLPEGLSETLEPTDPFLGGLCQVAPQGKTPIAVKVFPGNFCASGCLWLLAH